jgi:hypothetical protein
MSDHFPGDVELGLRRALVGECDARLRWRDSRDPIDALPLNL